MQQKEHLYFPTFRQNLKLPAIFNGNSFWFKSSEKAPVLKDVPITFGLTCNSGCIITKFRAHIPYPEKNKPLLYAAPTPLFKVQTEELNL